MKRAASGSLATSPASIALVDAVRVIHQPNVDAHTGDYRPRADFWLSSPFETSDVVCTSFRFNGSQHKINKKLSYRRETARQLRIHAQLTRCFSAIAV